MKLSDLTGQVKISAYHATTFIGSWFEPEDKICIVGRRSEKTGKLDTLSQSMTAAEFCQFTDEDLEGLIFDEDGNKYNLYFGVFPIKEDVTLTKRGKDDNISHVNGVWADLDIKEGGFSSKEEIITFLYGLELRPTIVVGSGSGGIHAYWKLTSGEKANKELVERWWSYLDESAGDRSIDKLVDLTRILRIPGTVYFPKPESGSKVGSVEILFKVDDTYTVEEITRISEEAFKTKHERRKRLIDKDSNRRMDMDLLARDLLGGSKGNRWRMLRAISEMEDYVNQKMTWEEILSPYGWTFMRQLSDGSNEWARPGRSERSAVVDYEDSPVMSLLSSSEETGLADLLDAKIPLTKYRVLLRLWYNDTERILIEALAERVLDESNN